jgi:hypothetical protein
MNEKRRRFVEAYLTEAAGNATKAAEIAGYSPKSARVQGSQLLTYPDVRRALEARQQQLAARADQKADEWMAEIDRVAFAQVEVTERGKMKALELKGRALGRYQTDKGNGPGGIIVNVGFIQRLGELPQVITIDTKALPQSEPTE